MDVEITSNLKMIYLDWTYAQLKQAYVQNKYREDDDFMQKSISNFEWKVR